MTYDYRYSKQWRLDRARGIARTMPIDEVRLHIATLQGLGWSLRSIAGAADVNNGTVAGIAKGAQARVRRELGERILAVDPHQVPWRPSRQVTEPFVPRIGTTRRIQALLYMGWGHKQMTEHSGVRTAPLLHQKGRWVTRTTHDAIAAMYRDLSHRPGPSSKARHYAHLRGYLGPLAWDDIDLDAEPEQPIDDGPAVEEARVRQVIADRQADLEHLLSCGVPLEEAVTRAGWPSLAAWQTAVRRDAGAA